MRRRLAGAIVGVTAAALLLFGLPLALAVTRIYRDEELIRVQRQATAATQAVGPRISPGDPAELPEGGAVALGLYVVSGARRSGAGPAGADAAVRQALRGHIGQSTAGGRLVVAVPVARSEHVIGAVRADRSDAIVHRRVHDAWLVMAAIACGVLLLVSLIAALLSRRLTHPVEALTAAVRRLGDGDFTARTPPSGIRELDEATAALDGTARRLGDLVDRERAFSADASHQLRTPLTALRLDLEAGRTDRALAQVDRLQDTVTTLLAAARDPGGGPAGPTALGPLLQELQGTWAGPLAASGRPLRLQVAPDLPPVAASAGTVRQILQVLVENAATHGHGAITVAARATAGAVAVDVADEGPGVAVTDVDAIFARRQGSGTGIGLSLARSLATAEGGRLVLQHGGPSPVFTLLVPAAAAPLTTAPQR